MGSDPVDADPAEVGFLWPKPGFFRAPGGRNETCATWYRWMWGGYRWIPGMQAIQMPEKENMQKGTSKATGDSSCISFLSQGHFRWLMPSHLNHDQPSSAKEEPKQPKPKQPKAKAEPKSKIPPPPPPPKAPMCKHAVSLQSLTFMPLSSVFKPLLSLFSWDILGYWTAQFSLYRWDDIRAISSFPLLLCCSTQISSPLVSAFAGRQNQRRWEGSSWHSHHVLHHQVLKPVAWHLRFGKSMGI